MGADERADDLEGRREPLLARAQAFRDEQALALSRFTPLQVTRKGEQLHVRTEHLSGMGFAPPAAVRGHTWRAKPMKRNILVVGAEIGRASCRERVQAYAKKRDMEKSRKPHEV